MPINLWTPQFHPAGINYYNFNTVPLGIYSWGKEAYEGPGGYVVVLENSVRWIPDPSASFRLKVDLCKHAVPCGRWVITEFYMEDLSNSGISIFDYATLMVAIQNNKTEKLQKRIRDLERLTPMEAIVSETI